MNDWLPSTHEKLGRGGSSSGSTSVYGLRGPGFNSRWELGFFSSLFYQKCVLNQVLRRDATLLIFLDKMLS